MARVGLTLALIASLFSYALFIGQFHKYSREASGADPSNVASLQKYIEDNLQPSNIRDNLRFLTRKPHLGGTAAEKATADWVANHWRKQGLDEVRLVPYEVLLSYPDKEKPNVVRHLEPSGQVLWESAQKQKPLYAPEESLPEVPFPFNGYSAPGNVKGDVVYANYGREEDFKHLDEIGLNVSGCIVLARYGKIFRANIADLAEKRGAIGVLLYNDPKDYAPRGPLQTYPNTVMMPPSGTQLGTVKLVDGDPLTPYYPSIESAFHIPEEEAAIPKIPVQPINYDDAEYILSHVAGAEVPADWRGGIGVVYKFGPGFTNEGEVLNMEIHTSNKPTTTFNVVGVIRGAVEPDRYVVLGNHRDAWIFGSIDPSSGTAAMVELSRVFRQLMNETGWRPRRSIVFCSWGSEEYGLVGSVEWTQQFGKQLFDKAVAYLNVDISIEGNYTLRTKAVPLLYDVVWDSTKRVKNPDPEEVAVGHLTVFDTWAERKPDKERPGMPLMQFVGSGSDYKGFQHNIGVPSLDIRYTQDNETIDYPLYHTLYETFALVDELYDRGFHFHAAVAALWGDVTLQLSESVVLPFSLEEYARFIGRAQKNIFSEFADVLKARNVSFDFFTAAEEHFDQNVRKFLRDVGQLDKTDPLAVRAANDKIMMVERAFIDPRGLPGRPEFNHVVMAPSKSDAYAGTAFAGLADTLTAIRDAKTEVEARTLWRAFDEHLAASTFLLETAGRVLTDDLW